MIYERHFSLIINILLIMLRKFLSPTKKDSFNLKRAIKRTSSNLKMNESKLSKLLSDTNFTETLDIHDIFKTSDIVNNPIYIDIRRVRKE